MELHEIIYESTTILISVSVLIALLLKRFRTSPLWRATVTPLASIIGSGFLVSAPLLLYTAGPWAVLAMLAIVTVAYGLRSSIRYNINHVESIVHGDIKTNGYASWLFKVDALSRPALGIAYLISVTFYLKLLSAFAMRGLGDSSLLLENGLTTFILVVIGLVGLVRGLSMLEVLETYSVSTKLAIIAALIVTFFMFNIELAYKGDWDVGAESHESLWILFRKILGMLIIVQGFETSRYLGDAYSSTLRVKSMRYAQWISALIYIVFVALSSAIFEGLSEVNETSVIDLSSIVASILPVLLVIAAIMSQFSAAISDTLGGGGMLSEAVNKKMKPNHCYFLISMLGIGLTWLTNIFQIIAIASKAFAFYYALQLILTMIVLIHSDNSNHRLMKLLMYSLLFIIMILVLVLGIPVE
jgi:hypothetical protein